MPVPSKASADLLEGWRALEDDTDNFVEAMAYYRGTVAERFANERIRQMVAKAGQRYRFRLASMPVKVMAKRCRIANVTSEIESVTGRIAEIREANQAVLHEPHIIERAFIYGDAYALVWPVELEEANVDAVDGEKADTAPPEEMARVGVEISYQSPLHCKVIYDAEDGRRPRFGIRRWKVSSTLGQGADIWRAEVFYHDRIERWSTIPGASGGGDSDWKPFVGTDEFGVPILPEDTNWPEDHDWDEIPIKHARTDLPYGEPVHAAAFGPQDAITKAISTQVDAGIEGWGWPERYRILDDQRALEVGREPVDWGDAADAPARVQGESEPTARRRGPGTETTYPGTKAVGEWTRPDPGQLTSPMEGWLKLMSVVTETPLDELDPTVQLSGVSREKADAPMRAKERKLKLYLDSFWREVYGLAARMTGVRDPGVISVHWAPPDVTMGQEYWETAQHRVNLGVPVAQVLAEANYLPEQVKAWLDSQGEEMALVQRINVLKSLGEAIQTMGVGISLGVIDQGTAARLIARVTGEVEAEPGSGD